MTTSMKSRLIPFRQAGDRHLPRRARALAAEGTADGPQYLNIDFDPATLAGLSESAARWLGHAIASGSRRLPTNE